MAKYKIWWQSSVQLDVLPGYKEAIEEHARKILGDDFYVEMHGVETSPNVTSWQWVEMLNGRDMMENFFRAQEEGFDCIAIGCFADCCLQEAREVLDIPVLGIAETGIMWAKLYGGNATIVSVEDVTTPKRFAMLLREYGAENFINFDICEMTLEEMGEALSKPEKYIRNFQEVCERNAKAGREVILPGCGLLAALAAKEQYSQVGNTGTIVLDIVGALLKTAEAAVILHERSGLMTSRRGKYRKPSDEFIRKVRKGYGLIE
ncbi:MAG: aspartate/glutamate racemase family protein [Solobacterium sp.]|nr:aspartate/glutamate racemase family protein [Solobacterium sp.]